MSEPYLERLSRFTPDAGRLDRDTLLFAAGRRSARPGRGWKTLASLLASTQALSLALLLWRQPTPPDGGLTVVIANRSTPPAALETPTSQASLNSGVWSAHQHLLEPETEHRPAGDVTLIESGPPLRAFVPPPPSLLN
jgi:hypothetical protein